MAVEMNAEARPQPTRAGSVVGIVVSDFHAELTGAMVDSAELELEACGVEDDDIIVIHVPGTFELPFVARRLAASNEVDSVLCFGLVLRGETEHDRWVTEGCVHGIMQASLETDVPIHLGVLTCATMEQARARALPADEEGGAATGHSDKGREVARAAIETLLALDEIEEL
jgi:6,7-dimethyl-8-ribityllumazine synthase